MKSLEQLKQQVSKEQKLTARLSMAASRVEESEQERLWAIVTAHSSGLSIRKIATATNLSSSRIHQLLHTDEASQIPEFLNSLVHNNIRIDKQLSDDDSQLLSELTQRLADEGEILRWCIDWLEKLSRGEKVVVNLRPQSDPQTAFVAFDQARVLQVLKRIAADFDQLSGQKTSSENIDSTVDNVAAGMKHRRRLAEPEPQISSLSQRDQRAILREKMGLPSM
jgi:transcriptional regulator of heat shock response